MTRLTSPLMPPAELLEALGQEFGKGFDDRNLRNMRDFYLTFLIWNAVRTELSWTHYRNLLRVSDEKTRKWPLNKAQDFFQGNRNNK